MSKIADRAILILPSTKVSLSKSLFMVEGKLGIEKLLIPSDIKVIRDDNKLFVRSDNIALAGTFNSLISNLIKGVTEGYKEELEIKGMTYKVILENNQLKFDLGRSHQNIVNIPVDLKVVVSDNQRILIEGSNNQRTSNFAVNKIQNLKKPNPYKHKGIFRLHKNIVYATKKKKTNR